MPRKTTEMSDYLASGMEQVMSDPGFQKIFNKEPLKTASPLSYEKLIEKLIIISAELDELGLEKTAYSVLKIAAEEEINSFLNKIPKEEDHLGKFHYKKVYIGDWGLSIQAGVGHYSKPEEDLPNLSDYEEFEVLISNKNPDITFIEGNIDYDNAPPSVKQYFTLEYEPAGNLPKSVLSELISYLKSIPETIETKQDQNEVMDVPSETDMYEGNPNV